MPETGNKDSLTERLRKRAEEEALKTEQVMASVLDKLVTSSDRMSTNALSSIEGTINTKALSVQNRMAQIERRQRRFALWSFAGPVLVSILILIGLWVVMGWKRAELNGLQQQVMAEQQSLSQLQAKTGGVRLWRGPEEQVQWYLVLPNKTQAQQFNCNDKPCIKLGRE